MDLLNEPVTPKVEGMDDHGWSNSPAEPNAVHVSVYPEVAPPEEFVPGQTNSAAVGAPKQPKASKPVDLQPGHSNTDAVPDSAPPGEDVKAVDADGVDTKAVTAEDAENK